MLSKDHLRFAAEGGRVIPKLLKLTPATIELAERILAHWRDGIGQQLGDLEDAAMVVLHQTRSLIVAKGLQKLVVDGCTFRDAASAAELRERAFAVTAIRLKTPSADPLAHRAALAAELGMDGETLSAQLYADLPDAAVLEAGCPDNAATLIAHYNLAQCQGLLLTAKELTVTIHDRDIGLRRKLLKALRFQRLLAEVRTAGDALQLVISGPGTVLDQASRYGLNLALFLPALACAKRWEATAWVQPLRTGSAARLELNNELGLVGDTHFLGFIPAEIRTLEQELRAKRPEWTLEEPQVITLRSGEMMVPDVQIRQGERVIPIELFHRWHSVALTRRLAQCAAGEVPELIVGVDRAVAKRSEHADLAASAFFAARGFLFNDLPTVRALTAVLER